MLVCESNGGLDCCTIHIVDSDQFPSRQIITNKLEHSQHLVFRGFLPKELETHRRGQLQVMQWGKNNWKAYSFECDNLAVFLRIIEFHQTTSVKIDHESGSAAGNQFTYPRAKRPISPYLARPLHKIRLSQQAGASRLFRPALIQPFSQLVYIPIREAVYRLFDFNECAHNNL
jgi:hypothetical protein